MAHHHPGAVRRSRAEVSRQPDEGDDTPNLRPGFRHFGRRGTAPTPHDTFIPAKKKDSLAPPTTGGARGAASVLRIYPSASRSLTSSFEPTDVCIESAWRQKPVRVLVQIPTRQHDAQQPDRTDDWHGQNRPRERE